MLFQMRSAVAVMITALIAAADCAAKDELCIYITSDGRARQVRSREEIPERFRASAKCLAPAGGVRMAKPAEIDLKGSIRREEISSSVGRISLRWPRKVELLFGRTPQRAMAEAAATVSRAVKRAGFPPEVQNMEVDWQVVFMDEELPEKQIPAYLVGNCHPAWMTPPANLYIVAQRVVAGCDKSRAPQHGVADAQLSQVLIHEMGHAVEFQILKNAAPDDRMRAEGFATWFEQYAARFSTLLNEKKVRAAFRFWAAAAIKESPGVFNFSGSAFDYARASMLIDAVVERRGIAGLMKVYARIARDNQTLLDAVNAEWGWDYKKISQEVANIISQK